MDDIEKAGVKMIQDLQAMAGITESEEDALKGWRAMSDRDKRQTELVHGAFFPSPN